MKASDYTCSVKGCDKQAVCFWPIIDIDIPHHPYCRDCVDEAKIKLMIAMSDGNSFNQDRE